MKNTLNRLRKSMTRKPRQVHLEHAGQPSIWPENLLPPLKLCQDCLQDPPPVAAQLAPKGHTEHIGLLKEENLTSNPLPRWLTDLASIDSESSTYVSESTRKASSHGRSSSDQKWSDPHELILCGPYNHLLQNPGKGFREQIINAFNVWVQVPVDRLEIIMDAVNMLHSASLLIDDIQDNSTLRRGLPSAHTVFGVAQTINSANYYYFQAMRRLEMLNSEAAMKHFADELIQLHRGQGMDLYWRDSLICPSEDDYLHMISNKTGGLFRLSIKLMQTQSRRPVSPEWLLLAEVLGLLFQIRDDYQNLCSDEYSAGKGYCDDITEGKFSFPIIHSIHQNPANGELLNILRQKPKEAELKRYAVACMEKTGSFEYTRRVLDVLGERGKQLINSISEVSDEVDVPMYALLEKLAV